MNDSIHVKELPWMVWLLQALSPDKDISAEELFQKALAANWIQSPERSLWKASDNWARSLPRCISAEKDLGTPEDVANFVMAMGEISARCHGFPSNECQSKLSQAIGFRDTGQVFNLIGEFSAKHYPPADISLEDLGTVEWVNSCQWDYESYRSVSWFVDHPRRFRIHSRWGLALGTRLAAELDFKSFGAWLTQQTDASIICPVLYPFSEFGFAGNEERSLSLLSSGHAFLELVGASSLHFCRHELSGPKWRTPLQKAFDIFDTADINREDAIWISFSRVQDIHSSLGNLERRIEDNKKSDHVASDGLAELEEQHSSLQSILDGDVEVFLSNYPAEGLSGERAKYILESGRGQISLPMKLAEKLPNTSRNSLLKAIIGRFNDTTGLFEEPDYTQSYLLPHDWQSNMPLAARAYALLYGGQHAEKAFSRTVENPEKELLPFVGQPYLVNRSYHLWTHIHGRLAIMYLYALEVAYANQEANNTKESFLQTYVTKQALNLAKFYQGEGLFREVFDLMSRMVVDILISTQSDKLRSYAQSMLIHPLGHSVTKLYLLWSDSKIFEGNEELAFALLAQLRNESGSNDENLSIFKSYINLIDRALAFSAQQGSEALTQRILDTWDAAFPRWKSDVRSEWAVAPHNVAKALAGDAASLEWLSAQTEFEQSMSKRYCDEYFLSEHPTH